VTIIKFVAFFIFLAVVVWSSFLDLLVVMVLLSLLVDQMVS
jgi:hypothetical protein